MSDSTAPQSTNVRDRQLRVIEESGSPVVDISVARIASNGTYLQGRTDPHGSWSFRDHFVGTVTILVGGPGWTGASSTLEADDWDGLETVYVEEIKDGGSLIILQSTGDIPGLIGRLNPIRDSINRNYIYADNVSINDSPEQPANFVVGEDFQAEDAVGNVFNLNVKAILGRTSLIQYQRIKTSPIEHP